MSKQEKKMGQDPLAWIDKDPIIEAPVEISRNNIGRPKTIYRDYEKSSQEGLPKEWTRATFILREDLLKKLKDYAYTERKSLKDVVNEMAETYLSDKKIIERDDKK